MTYAETLQYLFRQLPMYQRVGQAAYKADLQSTWNLMDLLDHPYRSFPSIHLAGTNGKGSSAHMLASILQEAGYKTGLYTSPHLKDFRERIRINGQPIAEQDVTHFVEQYRSDFESIGLSFFEWTVGLCFHYFQQKQVDIAIIETGMGGRLDSTNVITPLLSIITNIGLDHTRFLGDTIEKIAAEKAGIIKEGVPVVLGRMVPEAEAVMQQHAKQKNSPLHTGNSEDHPHHPLGLSGFYQLENQRTVLAALPILKQAGFHLSDEHLEAGFQNVVQNTGLLGRWQILDTEPLTVCDTAHNVHGLMPVMDQVKKQDKEQVHFVLGMVDDKNVEEALKLFPSNGQFYFCQPDIPRALPDHELTLRAHALGLKGEAWGSVQTAWNEARRRAQKNDLIYIGGSTFVVAEVV